LRQILERSLVLRRPMEKPCTFHLCFFSCQSYFKYLYCSLHSVLTQLHKVDVKVWIFSDEEQPLSDAQIKAIQALIPGARVIPWPKSMGWGATQIGSIWKAYQLAASEAADNDFVARVDSDVFFINDRIFRAASRSRADLVGDGHYVSFDYTQGGCYFLRASAVRKIAGMIATESIDKLAAELPVVVEDVAATHFARRLGLRVWLTWFMMFPDELRNAGGLTVWQRWKFSCVHFVMKNKSAMLDAYEREMVHATPPNNYRRTLNTQ
jgi:hypothetical protein